MAAEKLIFSRSLFMQEDGRPISFCMRPCHERKTLKPLIEQGGGSISCRETKDSIKLLEPGITVQSSDVVIKSQFVLDCAKANRLLDMTAYRCNSDNSRQTNDDDMSPACHIIRTTVAHIKGRQKYRPEDDRKIVKYLVRERCFTQVQGKKLWRDMALFEVTNHPAESMRTRYLKYILPNIKSYDFPKHWVAMMTGNTADAILSCDETSETTSNEHSKKLASVATRDSEDENSDSILHHMTRYCHNSPFPQKSGSSSETSQQKHTRSVLTETTQVKSPYFENSVKDKVSTDIEFASESEDEFDKMLLESAEDSISGLKSGIKQTQKQTSENSKIPSAGNESPHKERGRIGEKVTQQQRNTASPWEDSVSPHKEQDKSRKNRAKVTRGQKQPNTASPWEDSVSPHKEQDKSRENRAKVTRGQKQPNTASPCVDSDFSPGRRCGTSVASSVSTPDSYDRHLLECGHQMEEQLKQAFGSPRSTSRKRSRTSDSESPVQVNETSGDFKVTSYIKSASAKRRTRSQPTKESGNKKTFSNSLLGFVMEDTDEESQLLQELCEGKRMLFADSSMSEPTQEVTACDTWSSVEIQIKDQICILNDTDFQRIGERFGLTLREMIHVLFINTWSLKDAVHWIKFGSNTEGYPPWTRSDDTLLRATDEEDHLALEMKHGAKKLRIRREFLGLI